MKPILCIYHANCADGFTSAWVVRKKFGEENVDFFPGFYQEPPPNFDRLVDRDIFIVDFSYKYQQLYEIYLAAKSLTVIDHHKTAFDELMKLQQQLKAEGREEAEVFFDLQRSGAGLCWDYFFGIPEEKPRPAMINHVEDRDLWRFKLPGTREIQANIFSYEYDFKIWDRLMEISEPGNLQEFIEQGNAIERKHFKDIKELLSVGSHALRIGGHIVTCANLPYTMSSDAGHILAQENPFGFAACYFFNKDGDVIFSLRSLNERSIDVSEIAKQYGGGGHRNAAGFKVSRQAFIDNFIR